MWESERNNAVRLCEIRRFPGGSFVRIIISPAKKMNEDDSLEPRSLPQYLEQTEQLRTALCALSGPELQRLWNCNSQIATLNERRLRTMDLRRRLTPAVLAYDGIQYRHMAPGVFTDGEFRYIEEHLRILSGFYGMLRPLDGVTPYRLEMQAKLSGEGFGSLYEFWGGRLAAQLASETKVILNLASKEYSRAVAGQLPKGVRLITCVFGEWKDGRILEKGTQCKMARGEMVRYLAEQRIRTPEGAKGFRRLNYRFSPELSGEDRFVFLRYPDRLL